MLQPYFAKVLDYHGALIADAIRTESYQKAIFSIVRPGTVVLDIGTGTGVLALFACLAGARKVYAIEAGRIIRVAEELADQNGCSDRIEFINTASFEAELPELADVLITETLGNVGFDEGITAVISDAQKRLLKPGASIIPRTLELCIAPLESEEQYKRVEPWCADNWGLNLASVRDYVVNNLYFTRLSAESFLAQSTCLGRVDLLAEPSASFGNKVLIEIQRDGLIHGLGAWFRAELTGDIWLSNTPELAPTSWRHGFMPLPAPIQVSARDQIEVSVEWRSNGALWEWSVTHKGQRSSGAVADGFPP